MIRAFLTRSKSSFERREETGGTRSQKYNHQRQINCQDSKTKNCSTSHFGIKSVELVIPMLVVKCAYRTRASIVRFTKLCCHISLYNTKLRLMLYLSLFYSSVYSAAIVIIAASLYVYIPFYTQHST